MVGVNDYSIPRRNMALKNVFLAIKTNKLRDDGGLEQG